MRLYQESKINVDEAEAVWEKAKPSEAINSGFAEIWRVHFPSYTNSIAELYEILRPEEKSRSALFHQIKDKQRFIIGKAALRILMGNYLNTDPGTIRFIYGMYNKPALKEKRELIDFNISHSGDYILIAVANTPLGVDVEYYNTCFEVKQVMEYAFSKDEISFIKSQYDYYSVFYQLWTCKEALLKAISNGLNSNIRSIPCLKGKHVVKDMPLTDIKSWRVSNFKVDEQYTGSIACPENISKILFKQYEFTDNIL
jgi:4'-phosphopantetheinyl transferase